MHKRTYTIIFFILGLLILGYMVYSLGVSEIIANLVKTGWWFMPVLLSWLVVYWMNALAFRDIIVEKKNDGKPLSFGRIFQLTVSGYAINYITPFVALGGEPYRIMKLQSYVGSAKAASSVLLYGMMHILSHLLFWVLSIGLIIAFVPISAVVFGTCAVILLLAAFLVWWFSRVYRKGITTSVMKSLSRFPLIGAKMRHLAETKADLFSDIDRQITDLYTNRRSKFYSSLAWEFVARVIGCAEIYFIAHAIGVEMTYIEAVIVSSGSSLFANLAFFFPMQLGTREGGMAMAMASIGYSAASGVFISMATRIREVVWIVIGLILMLVMDRRTSEVIPSESKE